MTLALVKKGIPVTLLEALPDAAEDQRAATVHPPTVAVVGLKDEAFSDKPSGGMSAPLFHSRDRVTGELVAVFDISLLKGEIPIRSCCNGSSTSWYRRCRTSGRAASARCASPPR